MKSQEEETADEGKPLREKANYNYGPVKSRSCTDVVCLLLYLAFVAVWVAVAIFAFVHGDPMRVVNPTDSQGLTCGIDERVKDKPFLFFFDMLECTNLNAHGQCPTPQICVAQCPDKNEEFSNYKIQSAGDLNELKRSLICKYDVNITSVTSKNGVKKLIADNSCAKSYMESAPHFGRCVSKGVLQFINTVKDAVDEVNYDSTTAKLLKYIKKLDNFKEAGTLAIADLVASWPHILTAMVQAMILSLIYLALVRLVIKPLIWVSSIGCIVLFSCLMYVSLKKYESADPLEETIQLSDLFSSSTYHYLMHTKPFWLTATVLAGVILVLLLVLIVFLRKRVALASAIIGEASEAVHSAKASLLFPVIIWIFQVLVFLLFVGVAVYLYTSAIPVHKVQGLSGNSCTCSDGNNYTDETVCSPKNFTDTCGNTCNLARCELAWRRKDEKTPVYHILNLAGFLWSLYFINAFGQMVLAGVFASWYWTLNKNHTPFFIVTQSVTRTIRYHMGTIAFGALVLTVCRSIRIVIHGSQVVLKKYQRYRIVQALFCACQCFFWCLEKLLKFVSSNAYVMCAIHGKNFCISAKNAFSLLVRNVVRAIVLDRMTDFILLLGKLLIISILCYLWYIFFEEEVDLWITKAPQLHFTALPSVIIGFAAYFITTQFFYVYSVAVKTIFICFLEDCDINEGTAEKPYCMSMSLMKVLGAKNAKEHKD